MADDVIKSFLVSIGFSVDTNSQRNFEDASLKTEKRITDAHEAAADRRAAADRTLTGRRVTLAQQLARLIEGMEQDRADKVDAIQREQAERADKRDVEHVKKAVERRDALLKSTRALTVGMAGLLTGLAAGVTGAATGLLWATDRAAKHFERIAYLGQASGSSVTGLSRVAYAASQSGTSREDAEGSVAAFGENPKKLPALEGILKSMGIVTRDANGQLRDASALMVEYIDHLKELPQLQREARTSAWGITDATTRAVLRDGYHSYEREYDRIQGTVGADPNAAGKGAIGFEQAMRRGFEIIGAVKTRVETALFDLIKPRLDDVAKWVLDHGDAISNVVTSISKGLTDLATAFVKSDFVQGALNGLGAGLERMAKYVGSDAFKRDVLGFVEDVKALAHAIRDALEWLGILPSRSGATGDAAAAGGGSGFDPSSDPATHGQGIWHRGFHGRTVDDLTDEQRARVREKRDRFGGGGADTADGQGRAGAVKGSEGERAMQAMRYLIDQKGYTPEGAAIAIGNAIQESSVSPNGRPGDPGTPGGSHYMFQWNNGRNNDTVNGRRARYERWARENGRDLNDYRTPLDFFDVERRQRSGLEGQWHEQHDLRNAGRLGHLFEGYGDNSEGTRVQNARNLLDAYRRRGAATAQAPVPAGTSEKAITDAEVFAARQRILNGSRDPADHALVERYKSQQNRPAAAPASTFSVTDMPRSSNTLADLHASWQRWADANGKTLHHPGEPPHAKSPPLGMSPSMYQSYDNSSRRGDTVITHNPTFNIMGGDAKTGMESARMVADRGTKDLLRNMKAVEQ